MWLYYIQKGKNMGAEKFKKSVPRAFTPAWWYFKRAQCQIHNQTYEILFLFEKLFFQIAFETML